MGMSFKFMGIIRKYIQLLKRFFLSWRFYGFSVAFWSVAFPLHHMFIPLRPFLGAKKHRAIFRYLLERYRDIVNSYTVKKTVQRPCIEPGCTIWVCWWDGYEAMPPIVKVCYKNIMEHSGAHSVQLVTKHNFDSFVSIPEYIMEKVNNGIITITSFSDILRANLLYEYGGIWIDATVFVIKDISLEDFPFYTLKAPARSASVTLTRFAGLSNSSAKVAGGVNPQTSRWSSFLLAGTKHSVLFEFMRELFHIYWKDHDDQIDYILVDYIIALGYEYIPVFKEFVDNVPCGDTEKFVLEKNLNNEFSEENFEQYRKTPFHKLTWKNKFATHTKNGKLTIYGYLLESENR